MKKFQDTSMKIRMSLLMPLPGPGLNLHTAIWGRKSRYLGPEVPEEDLIWQDPIPAVDHELINEQDIAESQE